MKKAIRCSHSDCWTKKGFTLVEIVLVIAILVILTAIIVPNYLKFISGAKEASDDVALSNLNNATSLYAAKERLSTNTIFAGIPSDAIKISTLVTNGYLTVYPVPQQAGSEFVFDSSNGVWTIMVPTLSDSTSSENMLYQSDFSSIKNIHILKGAWQVINGILSPAKAGEDRAILPGTSGTDYDIKMKAVLAVSKSGSSGYGIYYRATEAADISGYSFQYDPGAGNRFVVKKVTNGIESPSFQMVSMTKVMGADFDVNAAHNIEISVTGNNHIITVDGIKVMDFNDSTFTTGSVGVRSWSDSQVQISDVTVTAN